VINFGRKIGEGTAEEVSRNPAVVEAYLGTKKRIGGGYGQARSSF
jgi:branched-chain amino acid transport system ATP-binding protein